MQIRKRTEDVVRKVSRGSRGSATSAAKKAMKPSNYGNNYNDIKKLGADPAGLATRSSAPNAESLNQFVNPEESLLNKSSQGGGASLGDNLSNEADGGLDQVDKLNDQKNNLNTPEAEKDLLNLSDPRSQDADGLTGGNDEATDPSGDPKASDGEDKDADNEDSDEKDSEDGKDDAKDTDNKDAKSSPDDKESELKDLAKDATDKGKDGDRGLLSKVAGEDADNIAKVGKAVATGGLSGIADIGKDILLSDDPAESLKSYGRTAGRVGAAAGANIAASSALLGAGVTAAQSAAASALSFVQAIIGYISSAISSFVSAVGAPIAAAITFFSTLGAGLTYSTVTSQNIALENARRDDDIAAYCELTVAESQPSDFDFGLASADASMAQIENVGKVNAVLGKLGFTENQIIGILANSIAEASLDSTAVETIYNEPFQFGPRKQDAASKGYKASVVAPSYKAQHPNVNLLGLGLFQWSNSRHTQLLDFANSIGQPWHDIGTQMAFMVARDSGKGTLDAMREQQNMSAEEAVSYFMLKWERPADQSASAVSGRQALIPKVKSMLSQTSVDDAFADSIISQINVDNLSVNNGTGSAQNLMNNTRRNLDPRCSDEFEEQSAGISAQLGLDGRIVAGGSLGEFQKYFEQFEGAPYVWAAAGPNTFDCSGLWYYSIRNFFNVDFPYRDSRAQFKASTPVPASERRPGDFVFYTEPHAPKGSRITHVAMYMGEGIVFHAAGKNVKYENQDASAYWMSRNPTYGRLIDFSDSEASVL